MRDVSPEVSAALASGRVALREFFYIEPRPKAGGARVGFGFWSGRGDLSAPVYDRVTGEAVAHDFRGIGGLVSMDPPRSSAGFEVQTIGVEFAASADDVAALAADYDLARAPAFVGRGYVSPEAGQILGAVSVRFRGQVDAAPVEIPAAGGSAAWRLTLASYAQDLRRSSPAVRSDADQRLRDPSDSFFRHAGVMHKVKIFWGEKHDYGAAVDES